jgi:glycosyltransferase involved in cell wall biosynthesis
MNVSTLILTHNEAVNLPRCLTALAWCDDIIVLDSGSTDATVEIARAHGARVLSRPFDTFADQRNFGLDGGEFRHDWVLHLDADEVVTPEFAASLADLTPSPDIDAYLVPSKLMLYDRWLRHAGMYPTYQVRLGHRDRLRFKQIGHGQREDLPSDRVGTFKEPYLHYNFSHGLAEWLAKHIRYAKDDAAFAVAQTSSVERTSLRYIFMSGTQRRRLAKSLAGYAPRVLRPMLRFFYILVVRQGFRDGRAGLAYAMMMAVYEGMIAVFGYEYLMRMRLGAASRASLPRQRGLSGGLPNDSSH